MRQDDLRRVLNRRRTGLVLGWGTVACASAALVVWLPDRGEPGPVTIGLLLACLVAGVLAPVFLRRAWSVPGVAEDPAVVRAHDWSEAAIVFYCAAIVFRFVAAVLLGADGAWVDVVRGVLVTGVGLSYLGMLVLATRWRPVPEGQL